MPGPNRSIISLDLVMDDVGRAIAQLGELNRQLDDLYNRIGSLSVASYSTVSSGRAGSSETPTDLGGGIYKLQNTPVTGTLQVFIKYPTDDGTGAWVLLVDPDEYNLSGNQFTLVNGALPTGSKVKCWYVY